MEWEELFGKSVEKYQVYAQCFHCLDWTFIQGTHETYGNATRGQECSHCGSKSFDHTSVTSKRTFNQTLAKKRKPRGHKKKK